jgi:hypothetical protein
MRIQVGDTLMGLRGRLLAAAWFKWKFGRHLYDDGDDTEDAGAIGRGSALLREAGNYRKVRVIEGGGACWGGSAEWGLGGWLVDVQREEPSLLNPKSRSKSRNPIEAGPTPPPSVDAPSPDLVVCCVRPTGAAGPSGRRGAGGVRGAAHQRADAVHQAAGAEDEGQPALRHHRVRQGLQAHREADGESGAAAG